VVVPNTYDLIAPDAIWEVWDVTQNQPPVWKGYLQTPFSSDYLTNYPNPYSANPSLRPLPNSYWQPNTIWSNNIVLVIPTNIVDLTQVKYSIAIDNDYWLYVNGSNVDSFHNAAAYWMPLKTLAPGVLHQGTNNICAIIEDEAAPNYFSMVVTTNACGQ